MKRNVLTILFLISWSGFSQPAINNWYDLGRSQSAFSSVIATDSCYYVFGLEASNSTIGLWDQAFVKLDLNGNVVFNHFVHSDTNHVNGFESNIIETIEGDFVIVCDYDEAFLLVRYDPSGYVLDSVIIDSLITTHSKSSSGYTKSFQRADSSFVCFSGLLDTSTQALYLVYLEINKDFELQNFQFYPANGGGYNNIRLGDVIIEDDGYLISGMIHKQASLPQDENTRIVLIKADFNGNEVWRLTDWNTDYRTAPKGLTKSDNNSYLYGGCKGWYDYWLGHQWLPTITKVDSNMDILWDLEILTADTSSDVISIVHSIYPKANNRFIAVGEYDADSMTVGFMIEFDLNGNLIWDSQFNLIGPTTPNRPYNRIYGIDQTNDGGFIMVGEAQDVQNFMDTGQPSSYGWIIKTDSVGCLVPGCQDFLGQDELELFEIQLYPNPSSDYLYIRTNTGHKCDCRIQILNLSGQLIKEWYSQPFDSNYILDVSLFATGTYYCVIETDVGLVSKQFSVSH